MCKNYTRKLRGKTSLLLLAAFFGLLSTVRAQVASTADYVFSTNTTGSLALDLNSDAVDMSTGTTQLIAAGLDAASSSATNIGFDFFFQGARFSQFSVNEDGQLRLSSTAVGTNSYAISGGTTAAPKLSAFNADLRTGTTTGKVHYKIVGTAPFRVIVVEFKDMELFYTGTAAAGTSAFQVRLYESKGIIEYVYGTMSPSDVSTSNTAPSIGFYAGGTTGTFASVIYSSQTVSTTSPFAANPSVTATGPITALSSTADGSRRYYSFVPPAVNAPTNLTFTGLAASSTTLNWSAPSVVTGVIQYVVYNSTDGITYNYVNSAAVGTNTLAVTGLTPNTNYYWKVYSVSEGALSTTALSGTQSTTGSATYYWVGTGGADFSTGTNWNTNAAGTGTARTTPDATDVLIVDGDGTTAGTATTISLSASASIGAFRITNNTAVTMQSSSTTTRTLTITGATGTDLDIPAGCSLTMNNATNGATFVFTGTGNTGSIAGTLTLGGGTGNAISTTGGTGTAVTVAGTVNLTTASATVVFTGSIATLSFANGASCNISGYTTTTAPVPTATWGATSNLTLSGGTTGTAIATSSTSYGNVTFNSTTLTATLSMFAATTITIQGNLTIQATNTGTFRALTSGTLTILGNLVVNGGTLDVASGAGTIKVAGNLVQSGGTITASGASSSLEFNGTVAQNATFGTIGTGTLNVRVNNATGINLAGTLSINAGATLTVSNGNITGAGTITYGSTGKLNYNSTTGAQTATALEFPATGGPNSLTINNTATAPNNTVSIPFNRALGTSGVLALTAGILNNAGNTITVANTATSGITGGSATAYVKGAVIRNLPLSLSASATYLFPVGKGSYNQMELVNPTTNAGGTVSISAEAFDAASGGTAGTSISVINTNRYWGISITNGAANLTNTNMRLYDAPGSADAIAGSATQGGAYALVGGATPTVTSTNITTTAPGLTTLLGYYTMGTRAAPVITNLAITPTGNQCTNVQRTVTVTVTAGSAAISTVVINYSVNAVAQTPVSMTNTGGNNWSGVIPTVTPANAAVTWSVIATDANTLTKTQTGTGYTDAPLFGATGNITATQTSVCSGNTTTLNATINKNGNANPIGTSTSLTGVTDDASVFGNRWATFHMQMLYTAAELTTAGLSSGQITAITFNISSLGDASGNTNYTVMMGPTTATALTGYVTPTFTTVFPAASYTHAVGLNTLTFSTPYNWDGTSNVVIDLAYGGIDDINNAQTYYTTTTANTVVAANSGNSPTASGERPNIIFTGNAALPPTGYSWSDGTSNIGTTNPLTVTLSSATTYTAVLTAAGCQVTSAPLTITTNPVPTAPTAANSTQCGAGIPTASVTSTAGVAGSGTFYWYDAASGGNRLQGTAFGSLTNYYVNDFSSATLTNASISGSAAISGGTLALTPATTSQQGGFTVNASGHNSNQFQFDFDLSLTATGTTMADGFSYSFGDDALATTTTPAAEHGSGSKLRISFDTYDAASGPNGTGIYVMYNTTVTDNYSSTSPGVLAYLPNVSWIPTSASTVMSHVNVTIDANGLLNLTLAGTPIITNLQLPPAYLSADKSTWQHVFSARSGGIAGGFAINNLALQANNVVPGYTTYHSSISTPTTFYVSELGTGGCESPRTPVAVTFSNNPLNGVASVPSITCLGGNTSLSVSQTGSSNNYALTWSAIPASGSGMPTSVAGSLSTPVVVTPTVGGTYTYTITGVDGACTAIDTVNVIVHDPIGTSTGVSAGSPTNICAGSATSLTAGLNTAGNATSIGNATTLSGATDDATAFGNRWPTFREQLLFTAAELSASGLAAGPINGMSFNISTLGDAATNANYQVSIGASALTALTGYADTTGNTTVFPPATYTHAVGINVVNFSTPYNWNGTSNIVVDINYGGANASNNPLTYYTATAGNMVAAAHSGGSASLSLNRPNVIFTGIVAAPASTYSWSNGSSVVGTTSPLVVNPTANTTYTPTITISGCPLAAPPVNITVNALPALATTGTSGSNTQGSATTYLYTDGSCDLIAGVTTTGSSLGAVTATVTVDASVQNNSGVPYLQRHYVITPANNGPASVKLYATQAEFTAYNTAATGSYPLMPVTGSNSDPNIGNIRITKYDGTLFANGTLLTPTAVNWNAAKNWWEITVSTPNFSTFFIHTGASLPLELHLLTFTGVNEGSRNRLDWTTATEHTGDKFVVQRSLDNHSFIDLGTVAANGKGVYQFYDEKAVAGTDFYRLLMSDAQGAEAYSQVVALKVRDASGFAVEAFPNPAKDQVSIKVDGQQGPNAQLTLTDISGRVIKQMSLIGNTTTLDMQGITSGIYLLRYTDDAHNQTIKINKQ
jgi:hypothetical protein